MRVVAPCVKRILNACADQPDVSSAAQRSRAWFAARSRCLTATDVAAVLGLSASRTEHDVLRDKIHAWMRAARGIQQEQEQLPQQQQQPPPATEQQQQQRQQQRQSDQPDPLVVGTTFEAAALRAYERQYRASPGDRALVLGLVPAVNEPLRSAVCGPGAFAASPDGIMTESGTLVEIKVAVRRPLRTALEGPKPEHWVQCQYLMQILGLPRAHLWENKFSDEDVRALVDRGGSRTRPSESRLHVIERDDAWFARHQPKLVTFVKQLRALLPPLDQPKHVKRAAERLEAALAAPTTTTGEEENDSGDGRRPAKRPRTRETVALEAARAAFAAAGGHDDRNQQRRRRFRTDACLANFFRKDPLLDWLERFGEEKGFPRSSPLVAPEPAATPAVGEEGGAAATTAAREDAGTAGPDGGMLAFRMSQVVEFVRHFADFVEGELARGAFAEQGGGMVVRIDPHDWRTREQATREAVRSGALFIVWPEFRAPGRFPGLIARPHAVVRRDFAAQLFHASPLIDDGATISSSHRHWTSADYRPVVLRAGTVKLLRDGATVSRDKSHRPFLSRVLLSARVMGCSAAEENDVDVESVGGVGGEWAVREGYIVGRRYRVTDAGGEAFIDRCAPVVGLVRNRGTILAEEDEDAALNEQIDLGLQWLDRVDREGAGWDPLRLGQQQQPDDRATPPELRPNMKNAMSGEWTEAKRQIAERTGDPTMIWNVTIRDRDVAAQEGVFSWRDPRFTSSLAIPEWQQRCGTIDAILRNARRSLDDRSAAAVLPRRIHNDDGFWQDPNAARLDIFVDFEAALDPDERWDLFPDAPQPCQRIYLIGTGWADPETGAWRFLPLVADALDQASEGTLLSRWFALLQQLATAARGGGGEARDQNETDDERDALRVFHWGRAEVSMLEAAADRHGGPLGRSADQALAQYGWVDLNAVFRDEPVIVRGALSFGLKDVAKSLAALGRIPNRWTTATGAPTSGRRGSSGEAEEENEDCADGADAMAKGLRIHFETRGGANGGSMRRHPAMRPVVTYNEADCRSLHDILSYLRAHHVVASD